MRAQLKRIEWLVSSLLKLSRLDAGAVTLKKEEVRVHTLVEKALASLGIPLEIKVLQPCLEGDEAVSFTGDFEWSCEALINIIKNCIEHTPEKGRLQISFDENPIYTAIRVADSGAGIAPEDLPHIFNRFYKGKTAAADQVGIGLAWLWPGRSWRSRAGILPSRAARAAVQNSRSNFTGRSADAGRFFFPA